MKTTQKPDPKQFVGDELDLPFWEGAARHKLLIQHCAACDRYYWPASVCMQCGKQDLPWVEARGKAKVYTFTVIHRPWLQSWAAETPYNVTVVELDEGPLMFTNVVDCANDEIVVGMPVEVTFTDLDEGGTLPQFRPATG